MNIDAYTKAVLTVIALALILNLFKGVPTVPSAMAHDEPSDEKSIIWIAGWIDKSGKHRHFDNDGLPTR